MDKCSQEGPWRCNAHITSKVAKTVDGKNDLGSYCSKDTSSTLETQYDVQGSSYQPSSKGDENNEAFQDDAEIPFGSSTNKGIKIPCLTQEPSLKSKVETNFLCMNYSFIFSFIVLEWSISL